MMYIEDVPDRERKGVDKNGTRIRFKSNQS